MLHYGAIVEALRARHPSPEWAFFTEVRNGTGDRAERRADVVEGALVEPWVRVRGAGACDRCQRPAAWERVVGGVPARLCWQHRRASVPRPRPPQESRQDGPGRARSARPALPPIPAGFAPEIASWREIEGVVPGGTACLVPGCPYGAPAEPDPEAPGLCIGHGAAWLRELSRRTLAAHHKPRTRGECGTCRPCPWVSCRMNLFLDVTDAGSIRTVCDDPTTMDPSCALDVAAANPDGVTLEECGSFFGLTRERVRQIEERARRKLHAKRGRFLRGLLPDR